MANRVLTSAYLFFRAHAGGFVGQNAIVAISLARAEALARAEGVTYTWEDDIDDVFATCAETPERTEVCTMHDADGRLLASLGAIWDADAAYRRVIEAELAAEYYSEEALHARKFID